MASSSPSSSSGPRNVEPSSSSLGPRNVEPSSGSSFSFTEDPSSSSSASFTEEPSRSSSASFIEEPSSSSSASFTKEPSSSSDPWIPEFAEKFEIAVASFFNMDTPDKWQIIADATGNGMTAEEAKMRYELLVETMEKLRIAMFSQTMKDEENEDSVSTEQ